MTENNQKPPATYHGHRKSKFRLTNETYNQLVKDFSSVVTKFFKDLFGVIKNVLLLWISLSVATQVMNVYFNNRISHSVIANGSYNTIYNATPTPVSEPMTHTKDGDGAETGSAPANKGRIDIIKTPILYLSQEYPSSQGYNYTQSINLSKGSPAVMTFNNEEQGIWFGIGNIGFVNANNPSLFLRFVSKCTVIAKPNESLGWLTMDPNKQFTIKTNGNLQPGSGFKLNPLFIKFPSDGVYKAEYTITSDNNPPISGNFTINVI